MPTLEPGHVFERYRVIRWLGSGVSGESYEAEDAMLMRKVTLKLIQPQSTLPDAARRQFFRELQGTSALNHPYLAPILDYGELHSRLYIARKFVSNGSLLGTEGRLWFRSPLNEADAIHYTHQLAQVLHYIHARGYLHGGITFSNILVLRGPNIENEPDHAPFLLADVGLAHFARRFGREQKTPLPITAAPEQFSKRVTPASDQFALAVLLYFWLAGRPPYIGAPEEIEHLKLTEAVTPLTSLNQRITIEQSGILLRALSVYPEDRYPSIMAFAEALLKTLPPVIPTVPKTEPAQLDGYTVPSSVPAVEEREEEPAPAASPVSETTVQVAPDFDREPSVTPVLTIESELPETPVPSAAEELESAPDTSFGAIPETEPAISFERDSKEVESDEAQHEYSSFAALIEPESAETESDFSQSTYMEFAIPSKQDSPETEQESGEVAAEPDIKVEQLASVAVEPAPILQEVQPKIARVIITSPSMDEPAEVRLEGDEYTIGRAGSSAILLDRDNLTSRHHALLKRESNRYLLFDLRSANGVFVNGQKILAENEYELLDGDHISIGNYELIFRSGASDREHEPATDQLTPATGYEVSQLV
jgi:serine/threonine protein kinase